MLPSGTRLFAAVFALIFSASLLASAASDRPAFVGQVLQASGRATVATVQPGPTADIVVLTAGLDQDIRPGMLALVERAGVTVGEVVVVESRPGTAAALVVSATEGQTVRAGDTLRLKTTRF